MKIEIACILIELDEYCEVSLDGYILTIEEPGFNQNSAEIIHKVSKHRILLPKDLKKRVRLFYNQPTTLVFQDKNGNKKMVIDHSLKK
jgi:hypothetical protein